MNDKIIYDLLRKRVFLVVPDRCGGYKTEGIVEHVYRDVMLKRFELWIGKYIYVFKEPYEIEQKNELLMFRYENGKNRYYSIKVRVINGEPVRTRKNRRGEYVKPVLRKFKKVSHKTVCRFRIPCQTGDKKCKNG